MRRPSLKGLVLEAVLCADMPIPCLQPESIYEEKFFSEVEFAIFSLATYSCHDSKFLRGFFGDPVTSNLILYHGNVVAATATCYWYAYTRSSQRIFLIVRAILEGHHLYIKSRLLFLPGKLFSGDG